MGTTGLKLPVRKQNRLRDYDYSQNGAYFITICSKDRQWKFWNVGASSARPQSREHLSFAGRVAQEAIAEIPKRYPNIRLDNYVVMPNHVHLLLMLCADERGRAMHALQPIFQRLYSSLREQ